MFGFINSAIKGLKDVGSEIVTGVKSFVSKVGSVAKSAWEGVKKVGAKIVETVITVGEKVVETAGHIVGTFIKGVKDVLEIEPKVDTTGQVLNEVEEKIGLPKEPVLDTGAKIMQGNAGKIEDYDNSPSKFYEHVCKDVEVDKAKLASFTPEERLAAKVEGCALQMMACSEKLGMKIIPEFANIISKTIMEDLGGKLTPVLAAQLIIGLKDLGVKDTDKIVKYLKGEAGSESISIGNILEKALSENCSEIGNVKDAMNEMEEKTREFDKKVEEFERKEDMEEPRFEDKDFN